MSEPLIRIGGNGTAPGRSLWMWCPACDDVHRVTIDSPNSWTWDGNGQAPTISPSILVTGKQWATGFSFHKPNHRVEPGQPIRCHSFVRAGVWEYQADCTHIYAGQTMAMVPLPAWLADECIGGSDG